MGLTPGNFHSFGVLKHHIKKILSISLVGLNFIVVASAFTSAIAQNHTYGAESEELVKEAFKVNASKASHQDVIWLQPGEAECCIAC